MIKFSQHLRTAAATAILSIGALAATGANAGQVFTVNPNSNGLFSSTIPLTPVEFEADQLNGASSAVISRMNAAPGFQYSGTGYITYGAFQRNGSNVNGGTSWLNTSIPGFTSGYSLYAQFQQTFACTSALAVGVTCTVTSITLNLYGDAYADGAATFTPGTVGSAPIVTFNGTQVLLGSVTGGVGTAGINDKGGAFQNVNTNFLLTAAGRDFFTEPDPFYTLTFNAFNNATTGLASDGLGHFAINDETGTTTFGNAVPEPGPLSLIGLGMLGMAAYRRKGRA